MRNFLILVILTDTCGQLPSTNGKFFNYSEIPCVNKLFAKELVRLMLKKDFQRQFLLTLNK